MPEVRRAFLARVDHGDCVQHVALCIAGGQKRAKEIASRAGKIFHVMFRREMHLDIMVLNEQQERRIEEVCQPFYDRLESR